MRWAGRIGVAAPVRPTPDAERFGVDRGPLDVGIMPPSKRVSDPQAVTRGLRAAETRKLKLDQGLGLIPPIPLRIPVRGFPSRGMTFMSLMTM